MSGTFRHQYGRYRIGPGGDPNPPPPFPTGLAVVSVTDQSVTLSWNAVVDIAAYQLWRAPTLNGTYAVVATTGNLTASDSGLTFATGYYYKISCFRVVGTSSALSPAVVGTTGPDVTAPTIPLGLVTSNFTPSSIDLDWLASTDLLGSGVHHYEVYRATEKIGPYARIGGDVVGLSYTATGLAPSSTYWFRLRAVDVAGNISGPGVPETGTTLNSAFIPRTGTVSGTGTNAVFVGAWGWGEDIVEGWDWTLPATTLAQPTSGCGVYTMNDSPYPSGWPGKKIKDIDVHWHALEPSLTTPATYNFSSITSQLNDLTYDGVILNLRGFVVSFPNQPQEVSAPLWATVANGYPTYTTSGNVGAITSLLAFNDKVKTKWMALIAALGNAGILTSSRLWGAIIHMPAASRGEEYNTDQGNSAASTAVAIEYIKAWAAASGANKKYLMWTNDRGGTLVNPAWGTICDAALAEGVGARGGAIESWLWNLYTPGAAKYTYQTITNGYLGVNEDGVTIAEGRGWLDENEAYRNATDPTTPIVQQNCRMANLRMIQMRRRLMWVDDGYDMNPEMNKWMALEAGKTAATSPDAWCCLMRTWGAPSASPVEIKNFERWLYQRDTAGAITTPATGVLQVNHGKNVTLVDGFPAASLYINLARKGTNIEFSLDADFLDGAENVAIKVTWFDSVTEAWNLVYTKASGGTGTRTISARPSATNKTKTATFILTDFTAAPTIDFKLTCAGGTVPFMFVRVIKL